MNGHESAHVQIGFVLKENSTTRRARGFLKQIYSFDEPTPMALYYILHYLYFFNSITVAWQPYFFFFLADSSVSFCFLLPPPLLLPPRTQMKCCHPHHDAYLQYNLSSYSYFIGKGNKSQVSLLSMLRPSKCIEQYQETMSVSIATLDPNM